MSLFFPYSHECEVRPPCHAFVVHALRRGLGSKQPSNHDNSIAPLPSHQHTTPTRTRLSSLGQGRLVKGGYTTGRQSALKNRPCGEQKDRLLKPERPSQNTERPDDRLLVRSGRSMRPGGLLAPAAVSKRYIPATANGSPG
jgi:hypothetical protein